ncbi:MAG: DUF6524 family protein [Dongiaceae bacterium]
MKAEFDWLSFVLRWTLSILLVLGTYNPFGLSYYDWVVFDGGYASFKVMVGVALLILHTSTILSTARSLGPIGIALLVALYASVAWVLVDNRLLDLEDPRMVQLTMLLILAGLYGMGLSWSHIRNQLSGQVHSIDVSNFSPV